MGTNAGVSDLCGIPQAHTEQQTAPVNELHLHGHNKRCMP